jgi:DNA-binding MarR family transcriptional regulator
MRENYIKVLQALTRMEAAKMPMISPRDIATDLGEDEQYISDILEVLEKQKGFVEKKAEWKGDNQSSFIVGTTPLGRMYLRELEPGKTAGGAQSNIITAKKRRLDKLEEQAAIKGISAPPEVLTEIEDLRGEIGELEGGG